MSPIIYPDLIRFLKDELMVPSSAIDFAIKQRNELEPLPMILWQYGLVNLDQLNRIYDWLDSSVM